MHTPANGSRGPRTPSFSPAAPPQEGLRRGSEARSEGSSYAGSQRSSSGSSLDPSPNTPAAFNPDFDRAVIASLNATPAFSTSSKRAEGYDELVDTLLRAADLLAVTTVSRAQSYVDSPQAANERIAILDREVIGAKTPSQLDEVNRRLSAILQAIDNPAAKMSCMFLRQRLEQRMDALELSTASEAKASPHAPAIDPFPHFASLMQHPAHKQGVHTYADASDWAADHGRQVLRASYLVPKDEPHNAFALGVTEINGTFNKLRSYRDASGRTGKMRVVHMHDQLRGQPKRRVHPTPMQDIETELAALKKARSPLMFERIYSEVSGGSRPVLKLYIPMPDLGIDSFFFCANDDARQAQPKSAAAAIRALLRGTLEPLIHLHRNEPGSPAQVHRDIKSENMLVRQPGSDPTLPKVNLIDFGLAAPQDRLESPGFAGTHITGAPEYHARQEPGVDREIWPLSPKVDIWSLAMATQQIFFTELTLRLPQQQDARPSDHAHYGLIQEQWQLAQSGQDLRRAQRKELSRTMPRAAKRPGSLEAQGYADYRASLLDNLTQMQQAMQQTDPAMGQWFFARFFRVDPVERFTAEQLASALSELPHLFGSAEADRDAAIAYFDGLYPRAQGFMRAEQQALASNEPVQGPSLAQLRALPALPPSA